MRAVGPLSIPAGLKRRRKEKQVDLLSHAEGFSQCVTAICIFPDRYSLKIFLLSFH